MKAANLSQARHNHALLHCHLSFHAFLLVVCLTISFVDLSYLCTSYLRYKPSALRTLSVVEMGHNCIYNHN